MTDNEKDNEKSPKIYKYKYNCKKCDYHSNNKKDFNKHLATTKHKRGQMDNEKIPKNPLPHYSCAECGKKYMWSSGLSKHKKKCGKMKDEEDVAAFDLAVAREVSAKLAFLEERVKELEKGSEIDLKIVANTDTQTIGSIHRNIAKIKDKFNIEYYKEEINIKNIKVNLPKDLDQVQLLKEYCKTQKVEPGLVEKEL